MKDASEMLCYRSLFNRNIGLLIGTIASIYIVTKGVQFIRWVLNFGLCFMATILLQRKLSIHIHITWVCKYNVEICDALFVYLVRQHGACVNKASIEMLTVRLHFRYFNSLYFISFHFFFLFIHIISNRSSFINEFSLKLLIHVFNRSYYNKRVIKWCRAVNIALKIFLITLNIFRIFHFSWIK